MPKVATGLIGLALMISGCGGGDGANSQPDDSQISIDRTDGATGADDTAGSTDNADASSPAQTGAASIPQPSAATTVPPAKTTAPAKPTAKASRAAPARPTTQPKRTAAPAARPRLAHFAPVPNCVTMNRFVAPFVRGLTLNENDRVDDDGELECEWTDDRDNDRDDNDDRDNNDDDNDGGPVPARARLVTDDVEIDVALERRSRFVSTAQIQDRQRRSPMKYRLLVDPRLARVGGTAYFGDLTRGGRAKSVTINLPSGGSRGQVFRITIDDDDNSSRRYLNPRSVINAVWPLVRAGRG